MKEDTMTTTELRRLLTEATPGRLRPDGWHVYVGAGMRKRNVAQTFTKQDARLIAAAINLLPTLLDVVGAVTEWASRAAPSYAHHSDPLRPHHLSETEQKT